MNKQVYTVLADAAGSIILLLATRYLSPNDVQFVKELIAILQPVVGVVIAGMFYSDKAQLESQTQLNAARVIAAYGAAKADKP